MADNNEGYLRYEIQSIIAQQGVFVFLIQTLNSLLQLKYQSTGKSPFDKQNGIISMFLIALLVHATTSVAEAMLLARDSVYIVIVGYIRLLASVLAMDLLLFIINPIAGWIVFVLWACFFVKIAYDWYQGLSKLMCHATLEALGLLMKLMAIVKRRMTVEPIQSHV